MEFTGSNFSEVYQRMCRALLEQGTESNPRAMPIRELLGVSMRLSNPRTRMLDVPKKKLPASFAIGEWLWTIEAREDLDFIRYYAPSYGRFSDDGVMLNGAYGPRIVPELEKIVGLLKQDVDSRRALVPIYAQRDVAKDSRDIPCTTTLQFLIRGGKLTMITTMRSNDIILGMPFDVFNFTMIQEWMACRLGLDVGEYIHFAGSLHYYGSDEEKLRAIISEPAVSTFEMPAMNPETLPEELEQFMKLEAELRETGKSEIEVSGYFAPFAEVLTKYAQEKHGK